MLDVLSHWVQTLVILILVLAFIQLFLPEHPMRDYVRLVLGLVVIGGMLTPMLAVLDPRTWDVNLNEVFAPRSSRFAAPVDGLPPSREPGPWIAQGVRLAQRAGERLGTEVRSVWEAQVRSLALLVPGVDGVQVQARWRPEGELEELRLRVSPVRPALSPSGDRDPGAGGGTRERAGEGAWEGARERAFGAPVEDLPSRLRTVISDYFRIPPEQVRVELEGREMAP